MIPRGAHASGATATKTTNARAETTFEDTVRGRYTERKKTRRIFAMTAPAPAAVAGREEA